MTFLVLSGTSLVLLVLGIALLVGFGADYLATRFRIPDVLWVIALGILVGPVLGLLSAGEFLIAAPLLGAAALILILFDAGLDLRLDLIRRYVGPSMLFASASYFLSAVAVFLPTYYLLTPHDLALSLAFAIALGCTSGAVIIPLATRLGALVTFRSFLHIDGAFEDTLAIITMGIFLAFLDPAGASGTRLALAVLLPFPVGILVGLLAGIVWLQFLAHWQDRPYAALATLGFLFAVYAITQTLGGSGILAALVLGGVIGNEALFRKVLGQRLPFRLAEPLRRVEGEVGFLLRSFFLFLVGVLVPLEYPTPLLGVVVVALVFGLVITRRGLASLVVDAKWMPSYWKNPMAAFYGRGLTSAVLLILALPVLPDLQGLVFPAFLLIVGTNALMTGWLLVQPPLDRAAPLSRLPGPVPTASESPIALMERIDQYSTPVLAVAPPHDEVGSSEARPPLPGRPR